MKLLRSLFLLTVAGALAFGETNPGQAGAGQATKGGAQAPRKKRVLAIGAVEGYQHDSVSNGLATIWKLGHDSGLWDTFIKTDTELLTKKKLEKNAKNIDYFDAIFLYTTGELPMTDEQKAALLAFVHDDGKGVVGGHSAIDTWYKWPAYGDMMGAYFDNHPWNQFDAPIIIEDRHFPGMDLFAPSFVMTDKISQPSEIFSREKVRVLARLDENKIDLNHKGVKRTDKDFAVAWVKNYGKGRVFYSTFGHREEVWDRPDVQNIYREAIKWGLRRVPGDSTP